MINWTFLEPRNLAVVAVIAVVGVTIYSHFARVADKGNS